MVNRTPTKEALVWLLPTGLEAIMYIILSLATLAVSNFGFIKSIFSVPEDFSLKTAVLGSIQQLLEYVIGEETVANLINYFFWALLGIFLYTLFLVISNFSSDLGNNLSKHYFRPPGTNRRTLIRVFVEKHVFQLIMVLFFVIYINVLVTASFPLWTTRYAEVIQHWTEFTYIKDALLALLTQIVCLHGFVVIARLVFMRKRLLGSYFEYR